MSGKRNTVSIDMKISSSVEEKTAVKSKSTKTKNYNSSAIKKIKHSKHGRIPEGWKLLSISKLGDVRAGATPSTRVPAYWGGNIRWMNSGELNLKYVYEVEGRITDLGLKNSSTSVIPKYSVLIGLAGQGRTRETCAINMLELCTNQSVAAIIPNDSVIFQYLFYNLDSRYDELRRLSTGEGGRGGLNLSIINAVKVLVPPLPEQQKIARILNTWDKAIEKTEQLIAQKQQLKKGLMQQLLTGKVRFKEFVKSKKMKKTKRGMIPEEWEVRELGDIGKVRMCKRIFNNETSDEGDIPFYKIGTFGKRADAFISKELFNEYRRKFSFPRKGEILISAAGTLGRTVVYDGRPSYFQDSNIVWIDNDESNVTNRYLYFAYQIIKYRSEGGTIQRLYNDIIKKATFLLPSGEEQERIVDLLSSSYKEINALEDRLLKFKLQKKGLMQKLLSGEVRVKL